ncbi:MAG: hypothetical protein A3F10_06535 [Coxiella sp. RIFCSPHIGHO2_12_FULL_42_15]|nr:MAG: hypothetical protein A3F10_06535 [Coxiella sp. RIFCSPHIGHO2_12_FULL_42_15]
MLLKWIFSVVFCLLFFIGRAWGTLPAQIMTHPLPNTVTLTFDDGPSPIDTPHVLDILNRYHIHAVFFVMAGLAKRYPDMLKKIIANGNVVASHTIWHPKLTTLSPVKLQHEIRESKDIIATILGQPPLCLRPPFLMTNANVKRVINENGMAQVMGFITEDYKSMGVQRLIDHVLKTVRPGMILIFHDGSNHRAQTVAALPAIIEGIKKKGLGFSLICAS